MRLFTDADDAVATLREYENVGVTHVIGMVNFGGVPLPGVRRTLEMMAQEIFPKFH